jgi:hypothetical protein
MGRRTSARIRLDTEKIVQIGGVARLECFLVDYENFVVNAMINFEQCKDSRTGEIWVK